MSDKVQTFLLNIAIIEGRHYVWANMNSFVMIKIDNQKKRTAVKFNSDCPFYNEYFVFEFLTNLESMLDKNVTITVIKPGSILRKRKVLGLMNFDVGTVWYQKDHYVYHKWAILSAPSKDYISSTRGYLKLDISVLCKGESPKIPLLTNTDEIEGNLFLPSQALQERQRFNFVFSIYTGEDCIKRNPPQEGFKKHEAPNTFIVVSYSTSNSRSTLKKNTCNPSWNEQLMLADLFPLLCQRFRIDLYHDENIRATRFLYIKTVSSDKEEGFLPTFGPSYIHFYSPNNLEGYLGKVMFSLQTVVLSDVTEPNIFFPEKAPELKEKQTKFATVVLFASIFGASSISRKFGDKLISFRISCGAHNVDESGDKASSYVSLTYKPIVVDKNHCYLALGDNKPCLSLTLTLPDIRQRMYNYNMLTKILADFKTRLDSIEDIFSHKDFYTAIKETDPLLFETLDFISTSTQKYIDIGSNYVSKSDSLLDQERVKMSLKEMERIRTLAVELSKIQNSKRMFQKLTKIYSRIEELVDIIEDWPQIYLWLINGSKRVAYCVLQPRDIIHSVIEEEKGKYCGRLHTLFFQTERSDMAEFLTSVCKTEVLLWMGLPRHFNDCIPTGFSSEALPKTLVPQEVHIFQARIHIFQARINPGVDKNSLCDPYVQVVLGSRMCHTEVLKEDLTPVWDETLFVDQIHLCGSQEFIYNNPPNVCLEVYDKDAFGKKELVGKCIITAVVSFANAYKCPKLSWLKVYKNEEVTAEVLAAVEYVETPPDAAELEHVIDEAIVKIPPEIKPHIANYRIEVIFWGVRHLKKIQLTQISKPKVFLECGNVSVCSDTIVNAKKNLNFTNPLKFVEGNFPEEQEYMPPLFLKMIESRNFGINVFAGVYITPMSTFFYKPLSTYERNSKLLNVANFSTKSMAFSSSFDSDKEFEVFKSKSKHQAKIKDKFKNIVKNFFRRNKQTDDASAVSGMEHEDSSDFDWWTKFYASLEDHQSNQKYIPTSKKYRLKVYPFELEKQPEFKGFSDILMPFPMYRGKKTGDETVDEENISGIVKGAIRVYHWPLGEEYVTVRGSPLKDGIFHEFPANTPMKYILRIYCVRGLNLIPKDADRKADPYIIVTVNDKTINDRENKIIGQLNPIFGRCFEINGIFPFDHTLVLKVMDYDSISGDDLIGETKIDIENRFYTRHRAHCGIAADYLTSGYCKWRGQQKPTAILDTLCKKFNISLKYEMHCVYVGLKQFRPKNFIPTNDEELEQEMLALEVLKRWSEIPIVGYKLVPEHVETRSLYNPHKPGVEQMWIDLFPCVELPIPKQVNIAPRKPIPYELRVIVWNASNVISKEKDWVTGEKKSDIFFRGWMTSSEEAQYTDIHYRSLNGVGNFNWRFIFKFDYLFSENNIIIKTKKLFSPVEEEKIPCRFTLQIWDNDTFSYDDFLGTTTLTISKIPRGTASAKTCSLNRVDTRELNLFKIRRTRGWWPLKTYDDKTQKEIQAGSVELEFELLPKEEAIKCPAGFGRDDPQGLPKPNRPESSFSWFQNPFKALKYTMRFYKKKCIKIVICIILVAIILIFGYNFEKTGIQKLVHLQ